MTAAPEVMPTPVIDDRTSVEKLVFSQESAIALNAMVKIDRKSTEVIPKHDLVVINEAVQHWPELPDSVTRSWSQGANCVNSFSEEFFPASGESSRSAKSACRSNCPAARLCLVRALAVDEKEGVWGGLNKRERQRVLKELAKLNPPKPKRTRAARAK